MDLIYQFNELVLDFYSSLAPSSLQLPLFQTYFILIIDTCLVFLIAGVIYILIKNLKFHIKREKVLVIGSAFFVNLLFLSSFVYSKISDPIKFLAIVPMNLLFYFLYNLGDWLKKNNIETRLDGNLNLKKNDKKNSSVVKCPGCNNKTISFRHAIIETQTCGECGKSFKAERSRVIEIALSFLTVGTFFLGLYLSAKCSFNRYINLTVMLSGFIMFSFYQLKPKKLFEVDVNKKK